MRRSILISRAAASATLICLFFGVPAVAEVIIDGGGTFVNLFAVETNADGILFVAREPGNLCGSTYHVERFGESPALLALIRDPGGFPCRAKLRDFTKVTISYEELQLELGERFQVLNSVEANTVPFARPDTASLGLQRSSRVQR